jgi:hypothetical protein
MSTPAKTPQLRTFVVFAIVAITAAILARGFAIWTLRGDAIDDAARDVGLWPGRLRNPSKRSMNRSEDCGST